MTKVMSADCMYQKFILQFLPAFQLLKGKSIKESLSFTKKKKRKKIETIFDLQT